MVPHHTIRQQPNSGSSNSFLKDSLKRLKIIRGQKDRRPRVSAIQNALVHGDTALSPGDSTPGNSTVTTTDGLGEVTSINEYGSGGTSSAPYSSVSFTHDRLGQQTTETQSFSINGIASPTATLATTSQIQAGQGMTTTLNVSLGTQKFLTTTTTTDVQGRVTQISQDINQNAGSLWLQGVPGLDKSVSIEYWGTGQRQSLTRTQGSSTAAGYTNYNTSYSSSTNAQTNTLYNWQQRNGQAISTFISTINGQGQTATTLNNLYSSGSTATVLSSVNQQYQYGVNGQLSSIQQQQSNGSWATISSTNYNSAGNNTGDTIGAGDRTVYDYSSGATFTYDRDGNVTSEAMYVPSVAGGGSVSQQTTVFAWDNHGNLLSAVTTLSGAQVSETDYFYDGLNRMISETVKTFGSSPTTTQSGYIYDGSSQLLTINLTSGDANQGRVLQSNFLGDQSGEILAIDMPGQTTGQPTPAVWLFTDLSGTPTSFGTVNSLGTWQIQQRVMGSTGLVTSTLGDTTNALNQTPVIWDGAQQQTQLNTPTLYDLNGHWYDPVQNRFLTPGPISATSTNPYTLNGNNPINSASSVNWDAISGPDAYSNGFNRFVGGTVQSVVGDNNLANASDTQLFLGTAAFSTAIVFGGWAGLGAAGLIGTGTAGASYLTGVGTTLAYASLGVSSARVAFSGGNDGIVDLGLDLFGVGALRYAGAATGLAKTAWMTADIGANAYQGVAGSVGSYQAFAQGNYVGGVLGVAGGLLGFAGAAYGARGFQLALLNDPTMNPLNYSYALRAQGIYGGLPLPGVSANFVGANTHFPTMAGGTGAAYNEALGQGVYVLRNPHTNEIEYVGRGDAPSRLLEHSRLGSGKDDLIGEILFNNNLPAAQAQSLENELMNMFGGPNSINPGTSLRNKIQGIAEGNPNFLNLEFAAGDDLVIEALRRLGKLPR